jgi:hypothetical protein
MFNFILYQFDVIVYSIMVQKWGARVRYPLSALIVYSIFATTTYWYAIFLQQPEIIKIGPGKVSPIFCENEMECKETVSKFDLKLRNVSSVLKVKI